MSKKSHYKNALNSLSLRISHFTSNFFNETIIGFNTAVIIALIFLFSYILILTLLNNEPYLKMAFSDIVSPAIELSAAFSLLYVVKLSSIKEKHIKIAWIILGISVLCYAIGDSIWAFIELVLHQEPFPSIADVFYLLFYPLFALGIWYLPRKSISRDEKLKLIMDMSIIIIASVLILGTFLIVPFIYSNEDPLINLISVFYIIGDIILLFAVVRILFNNFRNIYRSPLLLLGIGISIQVITDSIYSYQTILETYISGGYLDIGWSLCFVIIGLAAILYSNLLKNDEKQTKYLSWMHKINLSTYLPLLSIGLAYILLIIISYNFIPPIAFYIEIGVGIIILITISRQFITLNENRNLYLLAKNEITERKKAEMDLKESEEKFRALVNNTTDIIRILDKDGLIVFDSPTSSKMLGYPEGFFIGKNPLDFVHPQDIERVKNDLSEVFENNNSGIPTEFRIRCLDGTYHPVESIAQNLSKVKGIEGILIVTHSIKEQKKVENELKENKRYLETLISNLPGIVYRCQNDFNWTMEFVSEGCFELTGYHSEDIIMNKKISFNDLIHPDDRKKVWNTIQESLEQNTHFELIYRIVTADSTYKYVWEQGRGVFSDNDELKGLEGFITDITDSVDSERYYKSIFENTGTATVIVEDNTTLSLSNTGFEKLSGYNKEEIENKMSLKQFVAAEDLEKVLKYHRLRRIDSSLVPSNYEFKFIDKEGNIKNVAFRVGLISGTKKSVASFLDITERKKSRLKLQQSLYEKEMLLREVHHRVKNNMQIISSLLSLQSKYINDTVDLKLFRESQGRIRSMALVHEKLYQSESLVKINFKDYINSLISNLMYTYNTHIDLRQNIDDIYFDIETAIPCGLIINELVTNSVKHAFPNQFNGLICIELVRADNKLKLVISDNGIGLPEDFSLDNNDSLGLQLVQMLVNQLNGEIRVNSDNGAVFTIHFEELNYKKRI
ncbi:PAS domain S-box protein [Methanobacterium sp.]|uniref:PAS domain S-box protein n=1 Tax=Methanobacterium sp. TaxID=2164 RepID=UPI003C7834F5